MLYSVVLKTNGDSHYSNLQIFTQLQQVLKCKNYFKNYGAIIILIKLTKSGIRKIKIHKVCRYKEDLINIFYNLSLNYAILFVLNNLVHIHRKLLTLLELSLISMRKHKKEISYLI